MEIVYIETTIISYLVADPSRDIVMAAKQQVTRDWWQLRGRYLCVVSQEVLDEASAGDATQARMRLAALTGMQRLAINQEVLALAEDFMATGALPVKAARDAVHLAVATVFATDILLSWNCRHLVNQHILRRLEDVVSSKGLRLPLVCMPLELMAD